MKNISCYFLLLFFWLLQAPASGQPKTLLFERFTVEQGLPDNTVYYIIQDHLGLLWITTYNGLVKYDGYEMSVYNFPVPDNYSQYKKWPVRGRTLAEDPYGDIWIGTASGEIARFDRETERFSLYLTEPWDTVQAMLRRPRNLLIDSSGIVWVASWGSGVLRFEIEKFVRIKFMDQCVPGRFLIGNRERYPEISLVTCSGINWAGFG